MKFGALVRRKFIDEPDMSPDCSTHFEMDLSQDSGRKTLKRRKHKTSRRKLLADGRRLNTNYSIRRFRTQSRRKTYRVYCFEEHDLGIPHRFEKKLKDATVDNDVTTDSEQVDRCVKQGIASLREAIQQQHQ